MRLLTYMRVSERENMKRIFLFVNMMKELFSDTIEQ